MNVGGHSCYHGRSQGRGQGDPPKCEKKIKKKFLDTQKKLNA